VLTKEEKTRLLEAVRQYHLAELLTHTDIDAPEVRDAGRKLDDLLRLIKEDL
jgi:predicted ATPase